MSLDLQTLVGRLASVEMNALDRAIAWISPGTAEKRLQARARLNLFGAYTGARGDRRSMKSWNPSAGSANADTLLDLPTLRARSRDLIRNAPLASGAHSNVVTNVVGTGLQLRSHIDRDLLGLTEEEADEWERQAERVWRAWANSPNCDLSRIQNFAGLQDLAFRSTLESGDVLNVRRMQERAGDVLGLKIQLVEGDRISNPNFMIDTHRLAGGVEVDANGAVIGYHILNHHPGDVFLFAGAGFKWTRVPARGRSGDVVARLLYRRLRPNQLRGVPFLAPVIEPLKQLAQYSEAEIMGAVLNALLTAFLQSDAPDDVSQLQGTGDADEGLKEDEIKLGSGNVVGLAPGETVNFLKPERPNPQFDAFVTSVYQQIGVGLEIPLEVLTKHFRSSYSAARGAFLEAWKMYRTRRQWLADDFCGPVYGWAISEAVARGMLEAPGFEDPVIRAAWLGAEWIGPAQGHIDPEREIKAAEKRIDVGVSTVERETAEITGLNWEDVHRQRVKERRMREEAGLEESAPVPAAPAAAAEEEADPDGRDREDERELAGAAA